MSWLLLSVILVVVGLCAGLLLKARWPGMGIAVWVVTALFTLTLVIGTAICWDAPDSEEREPDYGLLLGCALQNGHATPELVRRCRTALIWMENHPTLVLIVSGGDPGGQGITEAAVMVDWLVDHGGDSNRIIPEEQAADTRQNLHYSKQLAAALGLETDTVAVITSEYHQTRVRFLAERQDQSIVAVSCRTPVWKHLEASVREVWSFVKAILETV